MRTHRISIDSRLLTQWGGPSAKGIDAGKSALVVVDMQIAFIDEGSPCYVPYAAGIVENINRIIEACRNVGIPVIFTRHTVATEEPFAPAAWQMTDRLFGPIWRALRPSQPGHALHRRLGVRQQDRVVDKYRYSAFLPNSSSLDEELRQFGTTIVIFVGILTNVCCESSVRNAHMIGYECVAVADAMAAEDDASHNGALSNMARYFASLQFTNDVIDKIQVNPAVECRGEVS